MDQTTFDEIVQQFKETVDNEKHPLKMNNLMIKQKDQEFLYSFKAEKGMSDVRSLSKTILTVFLGVLIRLSEEGNYPEIHEETYIYPIIKEAVNLESAENLEKLEKVQIKHLLTHTIGYDDVLLMRQDIEGMEDKDFVNFLVNYPIVHEPGEYYLYSNAGFYLLSAVLQEFLQEDLLAVMERELFHPLGIETFIWEKYGPYLAGATRLWLLPEDLMKFGELLLNDGRLEGKDLLTKDWLEKMLTLRVRTEEEDMPNRLLRRYGYGYGTWLTKYSIFFGRGTDGQFLIVIPDKEVIILTLAEQSDMVPIENILDSVIRGKL
ncbi:CubicO group peptidase, beta-lactamase class C family [Atopostipes suicloacalis DSM 15692]|uniref:CubicO group peptidase, beta-lactamase class C family n=1 Tax=Atopostipes suicloacalis DSM 15692 TaxID=1121025 RepID=A0A1M4YZX8_9LACT|nr:serine hydrolase [Atopostipes suicloacalis]SHF11290.1 CubicO group peptidase, beta-lactamase class C family [Atopostipes suicloacalis DSM 15692]